MMSYRCFRLHLVLFFVLLFAPSIWAQEPTNYYVSAEGKSQAQLKTALYNIIKQHTALDYNSLNVLFRSTDWHPPVDGYPNGYFWDMYSDYKRTSWTGLNREHSMPKSWFGILSDQENSAPIGCDLHNLYPSDAYANSLKSSCPLGEANGTAVQKNTIIKVGPSTYPGCNEIVFEPADEYKGDFARTYMYMVTCYEDYASVWQNKGTISMLYNNTYPTFKPYAVSLLLKWNAEDPVSDKEIVRNNVVYDLQHNRNPFVDHSELADFIWGTRKNELWSLDVGPAEAPKIFGVHYDSETDEISVHINKPEQATYFIENENGVMLQTDKFSSLGSASVAGLKNGFYILTVYTGNKRETGKFLIVR